MMKAPTRASATLSQNAFNIVLRLKGISRLHFERVHQEFDPFLLLCCRH